MCVSNTVALADQLRLQLVLEQRSAAVHGSSSGGGAPSSATSAFAAAAAAGDSNPAVGRLMIVKAFLGRTAQDGTAGLLSRLSATSSATGEQLLGKDGRLNVGATLEGQRVQRQADQDADAVYRTRQGDPKQRMWCVLHPLFSEDVPIVLPVLHLWRLATILPVLHSLPGIMGIL